jgi:hypothetical protein
MPRSVPETAATSGQHVRKYLQETTHMLWTIIVILFILWLLGFTLHVGGGLIHILLVLAVIVLIFNLLTGRRGV